MPLKDKWLYRILLCGLVAFAIDTPTWLAKVNATTMARTLQDTFLDATAGDNDANDHVLDAVESLLIQYPGDPLLTAYYGSCMSIKARDAWLPWNRAKFSQMGINSLNTSLNQLSDESFNKPYYGLNEGLYVQSLAAISFTNMSDSLEQQERGFNMLKSMMTSNELGYYPFGPRAWIHIGAVKAAINMNNQDMAKKWADEMRKLAPTHPYTYEAHALLGHDIS